MTTRAATDRAFDGQPSAERGDAVLEARGSRTLANRSAPPTPSSPTSTWRMSPRQSAPTVADVADAYFATFASASETTK